MAVWQRVGSRAPVGSCGGCYSKEREGASILQRSACNAVWLSVFLSNDLKGRAVRANIGVIGFGIVGKSVCHVFRDVAVVRWYDPRLPKSGRFEEVVGRSRYVLLCLPSPTNFTTQEIDLTALNATVERASKLDEEDRVFVIKSTVVPLTTRSYSEKYPGMRFAMVPEFLRESCHLQDAEKPDRVVIGADREDVRVELRALYRRCFPNTPMFELSTCEAELLKYMSNCLLATEVTVANVFWEYAQANRRRLQQDQVRFGR